MKSHVLLSTLAASALLLLLPPLSLNSSQRAPAQKDPLAAITAVLDLQQAAWNRGDVDGFMEGYWNSPELSFAGSSGLTRGWQSVRDRYHKNYPDAQAMGTLHFSELQVHPLGNDAALVFGRWHLRRTSEEVSGVFTLVFQRFPEGWRIIHDHTSVEAKKP
jgi:ketosteroid isomerase-like protein